MGPGPEDGWPCSLGAEGTLNSEGVLALLHFAYSYSVCYKPNNACLCFLSQAPFCARLSLESQFVSCEDILFLILKLLNDRSEPSELPT